MQHKIGWDIGGAHLKAVLLDAEGVAQSVYQLACPLWKGLHELEQAMTEIWQSIQQPNALSAVTMTGELVDLFPNRQVGVCEIAKVVNRLLGEHVSFYAGDAGWVSFDAIATHADAIASMNWLASAQYLSQFTDKALLIDMGSTTTDIIPLDKSKMSAVGRTDAQRMSNHALVYTGVVRTPLMALGPTISFRSHTYYLAAEYFATTADVYRLLNQLPEGADLADTADGKGKTVAETARRIARMVGYDMEDYPMSDWVNLANTFKKQQKTLLMQAVKSHVDQDIMPIIAVGIGAFLCKEIAEDLGLPMISITEYIQAKDVHTQWQAINCFPAYAVARLAQ
jgi:probable H4MPT-linked C1 transfer pathway protein